MADSASDSSANYVLLTRLADEFAARYRAGERPPLQEYIDRYPALADDIRELFPAMVEMEQVREDHQEAAEQEAAPPAPALEQLGDFRILREVGKGGMGIVYEAEQVSLGRHVALKVLPRSMLLDSRAKRRFEREAKSAARLHHTNIVPVFGVGEQDGLPYYVMQFIQGLGLDEVLEELKRLQLGNARTGTVLGSGLRVSRNVGTGALQPGEEKPLPRGELTAAHVARSLLTGAFEPASNGSNQDDAISESPVATVGTAPPTPAAALPLSDSFTLSSSSVVLPGHSRDGSKCRHRKASYWQSVASIGVQVAEALEYAHKQGVLHRDVKPSNLLLDTQGTVWVTDFGLAKAADDQQNLTHTGDVLGTLRYMPPEAFEGKTDARSDVYSLGLTLYEMLAFRPAFDEKERNRLIKQVTHAEPVRLGKLNRAVPRDLETVVHKAIDRDPGRRYSRAADLAADLHRFLDDEPIQARRTSTTERLARWCRRNPMIAGLAAALAVVFVLGFAGVAWKWQDAERQKVIAQAAELEEAKQKATAVEQSELATREAEQSRRLLYAADMNLAYRAWEAGDTGRARAMLERQWPREEHTDLRGFEWYHLWGRCRDASTQTLRGHASGVVGTHLSKDGRTLVSADGGGRTCVWDLASGRHEDIFGPVALAQAPDGKTLALRQGWQIQLWSLAERRVTASYPLPEWPFCAAYSPEGNRLALGLGDGSAHVFDLTTQRELNLERAVPDRLPVIQVAFSPDGRTLASGNVVGLVQLWNLDTGRKGLLLKGHTTTITGLHFTPDGKTLASASQDASIRLWGTATGKHLHTWREARTSFNSVTIAPDGRRLAAAGQDGTIRLWDIETRQAMDILRGHTAWVTSVTFAPDGQTLYSGSEDHTVKAWDLTPRQDPNLLTGNKGLVWGIAFSHDGKTLAVSDTVDFTVRLWDMESHQWVAERLKGHESVTSSVSFSPDDRLLASTGFDKTLRLWDVASHRRVAVLPEVGQARTCDFSPDGKLVAASGQSWQGTKIWDVGTHQRVKDVPGSVARFSPVGALLASAEGNAIQLWNTGTWRKQNSIDKFSSPVWCLAFARDGKTLAGCEQNGTIRLWDVDENREIAHHVGHTSIVLAVAFAPDGRRLATAGVDGTVKLWDLPSLREVAMFTGHEGPVNSVAFSPDGLTLASASEDATVRLWQALPADQVQRSPAETQVVSKPMDVVRFFGLELLEKAQATVTSNGQEYVVHVTAVDSTDWHVQLLQKFDDLVEGGTYKIRFRAKADVARDIALHAQRNGVPDWQNIGLNARFFITEKWETYETRFRAKDIAATINKIHFILGQQTGTVWIADFTVTRLADADPNDPEVQSQAKRQELMQAAERGSKEALPLLAADVAADPKDTFRSLKAAALLGWFGQEKDLAAMLQHIRAFAKDTTEAETADRAAKACSLVPAASKAEREAALALARKAVELDAAGKIGEWTHLALGMAEYRSGHYAAALEALEAAAKAGPNNLRVTGIAAFYRAMSLFRQGKEAEARRVASAAAATMKPLPKDEQRPLADQKDYHDDLILWLAYKEAKAMIKFDEASPPKGPKDKE